MLTQLAAIRPLFLVALAAAPQKALPQWIWERAEPAPGERVHFQRAFELDAPALAATLRGSCDNRMEVWLNGARVAVGESWQEPLSLEVGAHLRQGANLLAVRGENEGGPAGLQLELSIELANGPKLRILTDASWSASLEAGEGWERELARGASWHPAHVFGPLGMPPWGSLAPAREEESELELLEGFRAERIYAVPRDSQGSWVSLAADDRGRLYACAEAGPLLRILPPPLDAPGECAVERVEVDLGEAQGLLWAYDSLFVVVNGRQHQSGLYRVTDEDRDGRLDRARLLKSFEGWGEHGPHAVLLSPNGDELFVLGGNHTRLPEGVRARNWAEDLLLPRIPDPRGHAVGILAPGGWVCRTDLEGRAWDVLCWGLRNAYDAAFDRDGELFAFDSDMEWDVGLPWYRPTRVLHLVQNGEYGWRHGSGKWPDHYADSLPSVIDLGRGSPTGVCFGFGARFPEQYERALFVADWAFGTIHAVHLEARGASYGARSEVFLRGRPLPVTDLAVGVDGALYFTTGGRGMRSALYRVTHASAESPEGDRPFGAQEEAAAEARALRQALERASARPSAGNAALARPYLGHEDRFLRFAARNALESAPLESWSERALAEAEPRAAIEGALALARSARVELRERVLELLHGLDFDRLPADAQLALLRAYELVLVRMGDPQGEARERVADRLAALFPRGRPALDRELAALLAHLGDARVIEPALRLMESASTQEEAIHQAYALRVLGQGWTLEQRARYERWFDEVAIGLRGGESFARYLEIVRGEARGLEARSLPVPALPRSPGPRFEGIAPLELAERSDRRWTSADLEPRLAELASGRTHRTGAAAYLAALCHTCHSIGGEGASTGPDLAGTAGRFGPRDLLEALLSPSAAISDQYVDHELTTHDDELFVGRIELEQDGKIRLRTLPPEEALIELDASEIAKRRARRTSRMPEGLLDRLSAEEILDLMAFLLAEGDPDAPAFRR